MTAANAVKTTAPKIESSDLSLGDLFKDFYVVPDFQREYVWQPANVEKLFVDVLDEFYDEENRLTGESEYFIGSVVTCPDDGGTFQLIDGQQRLTTIYLAVCAIRDHLTEIGDSPSEFLQGIIKAVSQDRRTGMDIARYRLALQYEDSHNVLEIIAKAQQPTGDIPETTASIRNIVEAYRTIREFLKVNFDDDIKRIKEFQVAFLWRVKLIRIITPNLAHALKVFETINDRGVGLNAMDLLKNLLFMRTTPAQYQKLKDRWKELIDTVNSAGEKPLRFLRYFIMSHHEVDWGRGLREDEIYAWFVAHTKECGIDSNPLKFVEDLQACASAYRNFLGGKHANGEVVPYLQNISMVAGGAVRQHLILLLAARKLPIHLFTELCRNIENLFFCYLITREPTKTFERNFARWSSDLRAVTDSESLQAFVEKNFTPDLIDRSKNFDFALTNLTQENVQRYRMRYILAKLTQYVDQHAWDNPAHATLGQYLAKTVDVEHILPQAPAAGVREAFDKPAVYALYTLKLGNLAILEKTINSSVSNGPYGSKKPGYRQSAFLLTRSLAEMPQVGTNTRLNRAVEGLLQFNVWDSAAIDERQQMLAHLARRVWMTDIPVESKSK